MCGKPSNSPIVPTEDEFLPLRDLIYDASGIYLSDSKRTLVASRLARRVRQLGLPGLWEYYQLVKHRDPDGVELQHLINAISTNKTHFFRESHHFDFLMGTVLPELTEKSRRGGPRKLRIWCGAASTGQEPYTIAMCVAHHFGRALASWDIEILSTDINTKVLEEAHHGVYESSLLAEIPLEYHRHYLLRGTGDFTGCFAIKPFVRNLVRFERFNLTEDTMPTGLTFDAVFLRNVMIYFDSETQARVMRTVTSVCNEGGHVFLGHAESNHTTANTRLVPLGNTVFCKK
jgi:chemotaxis protein methyltransferase CheR